MLKRESRRGGKLRCSRVLWSGKSRDGEKDGSDEAELLLCLGGRQTRLGMVANLRGIAAGTPVDNLQPTDDRSLRAASLARIRDICRRNSRLYDSMYLHD